MEEVEEATEDGVGTGVAGVMGVEMMKTAQVGPSLTVFTLFILNE